MRRSGPSPVSGRSLRRRSLLFGGVGGAAMLAGLGRSGAAVAQEPPPVEFDVDTDNFIEFFQPSDEQAGQSPAGDLFAPMDATTFVWVNHLTSTAWFDAVAPYHPTAVGVHTRLGRRPSSEATNRNLNTALIHAMHQVVKVSVPEREPVFRQLMTLFGLDPGDASEDPTSPVGIGNLAGKGVIAARVRDGMNLLGDEGRRYHPQPFADYTGYEPVNTAFELVDPSRWQPQLTPHRRRLGPGPGDAGIFTVQHFVTPQLRLTKPYSFRDPDRFRLAPPYFTRNPRSGWYRRAVDEVLEVSAALTDEQKVLAEFFDNKVLGLGHSTIVIARNHSDELGIHGWASLFLTHLLTSLDVLIAVWHQKAKYDAVRPVSAIRHVYGSRPVTAWGGVGMGTVDDLPADEWRSFLNVADHPEYPSASAALCAAQAQATRRFFGDDVLDWRFSIPAGWSLVEPAITPANDMELYWATWTDFVKDCAESRVWGGVHFPKTQERSVGFGEQFGDRAYEFVQRHVNGDVDR